MHKNLSQIAFASYSTFRTSWLFQIQLQFKLQIHLTCTLEEAGASVNKT